MREITNTYISDKKIKEKGLSVWEFVQKIFFNVHRNIKWTKFLEPMQYKNFTKQCDYAQHGYVGRIKFQFPDKYLEEDNIR